MSNLTLSIDDELLEKARLYAIAHDTSVNAMVREYLSSIAAQVTEAHHVARPETVAPASGMPTDDLRQLTDEVAAQASIPAAYRFRREEAYEDRLAQFARERVA